jgi:hypothetical protein
VVYSYHPHLALGDWSSGLQLAKIKHEIKYVHIKTSFYIGYMKSSVVYMLLDYQPEFPDGIFAY